MEKKKGQRVFWLVRGLVKLFYPAPEIIGAENLPEDACIVVGNHTQMNGPIVGEIYFPGPHYIWCAAQMMTRSEVAEYAFEDFWSQKPRRVRWFFKIVARLIPPLSVAVFTNAHTIPVYRDARIVATFRETIQRLKEGANVIIFPEHDPKYNHILYEFQDRFIDVAQFYWRQTGRELAFVPMYIAPRLKKVYLGRPIRYRGERPVGQERERVRRYLVEEITRMAESLPEHIVVPYRKLPGQPYSTNLPPKGGKDA